MGTLTLIDRAVRWTEANRWYQSVTHETNQNGSEFPTGTIQVLPRQGQGARMDLEGILDAITAHTPPPTRILLVSHGSSAGLGIPIRRGGRARTMGANRQTLGQLTGTRRLDGERMIPLGDPSINVPATNDQLAAIYPGMNAAQISSIRSKRNAVAALGIQHLDIRACSVGSDANTMQDIAEFFGIPNICAPIFREAFGTTRRIEIISDPQQLSQRIRAGTWVPYAVKNRTPSVYIQAAVSGSTVTAQVVARTPASVEQWMRETFRPGNAFRPGMPLVQQAIGHGAVIHGVWMPTGGLTHLPGASRWQGGILFPGMSAYVQNLTAIQVRVPSPAP